MPGWLIYHVSSIRDWDDSLDLRFRSWRWDKPRLLAAWEWSNYTLQVRRNTFWEPRVKRYELSSNLQLMVAPEGAVSEKQGGFYEIPRMSVLKKGLVAFQRKRQISQSLSPFIPLLLSLPSPPRYILWEHKDGYLQASEKAEIRDGISQVI